MNQFKCRFCGNIQHSEKKSCMCDKCGQKICSKLVACVICGKERYTTSSPDRPCAECVDKRTLEDESHLPKAQYKCRNGHMFTATERSIKRCPECGVETRARLKICERCGKEHYSTWNSKLCSECNPYGKRLSEKSETDIMLEKLFSEAPICVHKHIKAEIMCRPATAKKIAREAKTEAEAINIRKDADTAYFRGHINSGTFGISDVYGG